MIATLRLEAIGDNHVGRVGLARRKTMGSVPREQREAVLQPSRRPWVARILGPDRKFGLRREFLTGLKDYREANGTGSRGVYLTFVLRDGELYEVQELLSWSRERRYFCHVKAGKIVEMTAAEVTALLDMDAATIQSLLGKAAAAL